MTFGFSLYTISLLVTQVIFFEMGLKNLVGRKPPEGDEICYCQYWKCVLVLVNFQDKLVQCKLPDYILGMLPRVVI